MHRARESFVKTAARSAVGRIAFLPTAKLRRAGQWIVFNYAACLGHFPNKILGFSLLQKKGRKYEYLSPIAQKMSHVAGIFTVRVKC